MRPNQIVHAMSLAGILSGVALLVSFFYFVQHSRALQPRPLPSVHKLATGGKTNVLVVVAHPDDESMFFGPTLLSLAQLDIYNIGVLCFSTGNADGLGNVRKSEMASACSVLKVHLVDRRSGIVPFYLQMETPKEDVIVPVENVDVVDHPALQDGFSSLWDQSLIVKLVRQTVVDHRIQVVLTFDNHGISGHPNHRSVHSGVRAFLVEEGKSTKGKGSSVEEVVHGWELVSTNILRKYSGPVELCAPLLKSFFNHQDRVHYLANPSPWTSIVAMSQHKSQWVWYRRLFVLFSRYTYINTLREMPG